MKTLEEWLKDNTEKIDTIQGLLNVQISDDMGVANEQLRGIEAWFSHCAKFLADLDYYITEAKTNKADKIEIAKVERFRDIVNGQLKHIDKRITVIQSLLKVYGKEYGHFGK